MVPIKLDALVLDHDTSVAEAMADFSRLPYCNGNEDINPRTANISEDIVSQPFADKNLVLKAGVHLHWALPDALNRGSRPDKNPRIQFPVVPNRWLITRVSTNPTTIGNKKWIVESDYLYPKYKIASAPKNNALTAIDSVSYPFSPDWFSLGDIKDIEANDIKATQQLTEISKLAGQQPQNDPEHSLLIQALNCKVLLGKTLQSDSDFLTYCPSLENTPGTAEIYKLREQAKKNANHLAQDDQIHLNRLLLEFAFPDVIQQNHQPFRFLGRQIEIDDAQGIPNNPADQYLYQFPQPLTAVGYGQLSFAAFYPNCRSVFGFYDSEITTTENLEKVSYKVVGWYSEQDQDFIKTFSDNYKATHTKHTNIEIMAALDWACANNLPDILEQSCYYAKISFSPAAKNPTTDNHSIAIGNTGTEALSAFTATQVNVTEDQLEAVQLHSQLVHRKLDVGYKFVEARHTKGFSSLHGGTLWSIRPVRVHTSKNKIKTPPTLPESLAAPLDALNKCQQKFDHDNKGIEPLQTQLFSDWYKYMLCAYPPEDTLDSYPRADQAGDFIRQTSIPDWQNQINQTDRSAVYLEDALITLKTTLDAHNRELRKESIFTYELKQIAAPRYWQPNEPVVLITGDIAKASDRHSQTSVNNLLQCYVWENTGDDSVTCPFVTVDDLHSVSNQIDSILSATDNVGHRLWNKQPWHPFLLEWEVEVFPAKTGVNSDMNRSNYASDLINDNYQLKEIFTNDQLTRSQMAGCDLTSKSGTMQTIRGANMYSGSSLLTPHAKKPLIQQLTNYPGTDKAELKAALQLLKPPTTEPDFHCLSQSLSGFNRALLMHKQTLQLRVGDPLGFDDERSLSNIDVRQAVQNSPITAPQPENDFNPIRTGRLDFNGLRLVDTFGQVSCDLLSKSVIVSETLSSSTNQTHTVNLPPRLVQPARLNFRWLSANASPDHEEVEMNAHPATSPICGWVLANNLDNSLMIYNQQGNALGSIDQTGTWQAPPGGGGASIPANKKIPSIRNSHLKNMVRQIMDNQTAQAQHKPNFIQDFISTLDNAMENIEPENFAQHQGLALLMGCPLALVRATVKLELQGPPATHQGWTPFINSLKGHPRQTDDFTQVKFPVRIGEYNQLNDGVVGYWDETKPDDIFYAPQSLGVNTVKNTKIIIASQGSPNNLQLAIKDEPVTLAMLIDPRGSVHATSGILPTKVIDIPPDQYAAALQAINITFLSTPLLTPTGKINLPLPQEPGYVWSWLQCDKPEKPDDNWQHILTLPSIEKSVFIIHWEKVVAEENWGEDDAENLWDTLLNKDKKHCWLQPIAGDKTKDIKALITPKDQCKSRLLPEPFAGKEAQLEKLLDLYGTKIGNSSTHADFDGPLEIREGWLQLSPQPKLPSKQKTNN